MQNKSRCGWIRYPCSENAPSANKFPLGWFIPGIWAGQKCSHETSFLEPGLFCWNRAKHSWLSPCLRKSAWGNPPVLLADPFQDRRNSAHKSLAPKRMHLVDSPQGQGCWELCSCPLKLTSFDVRFTGRLQQGLGSFWLPGNCSFFEKLRKVSVQFGSNPNFIYTYIYFKPYIFKALETLLFSQLYLIIL